MAQPTPPRAPTSPLRRAQHPHTVPQIVIYPKEVAQLRGTGYDAGKRFLRRLRDKLGKPRDAAISVLEFCAATGLSEAEVRAALRHS